MRGSTPRRRLDNAAAATLVPLVLEIARMDAFDEASYREGRADFTNGLSLRSLVEQYAAAEAQGIAHETKAMSRALGFADALLDKLRSL